jgi:hypothetical protein
MDHNLTSNSKVITDTDTHGKALKEMVKRIALGLFDIFELKDNTLAVHRL